MPLPNACAKEVAVSGDVETVSHSAQWQPEAKKLQPGIGRSRYDTFLVIIPDTGVVIKTPKTPLCPWINQKKWGAAHQSFA